MSHKKKIHQTKITELKKVTADLAGTGVDVSTLQKDLMERNFNDAKSKIRYFRNLFNQSGHGGSYRENTFNQSQDLAAEQFLKDTEEKE